MTKIAAFSCLHGNLVHKGYFGWLIGQIEAFKPDYIVNLGDWFEGLASKRWPKHDDEDWSVFEEHRAVASQANQINAAAPGAKKIWLWGNHDENLLGNLPERIPKDLREAVKWQNFKPTADALESWQVVEKYGHAVYKRLGPVTFAHGCELSKAGIVRETVFYSTPYGLRVSGHTHRPTQPTQLEYVGAPLPYWNVNPGCGADWDRMHYITRQNARRWGRGLVLIETTGVESRRTAYAGKNWDCELRIHSMADTRF